MNSYHVTAVYISEGNANENVRWFTEQSKSEQSKKSRKKCNSLEISFNNAVIHNEYHNDQLPEIQTTFCSVTTYTDVYIHSVNYKPMLQCSQYEIITNRADE